MKTKKIRGHKRIWKDIEQWKLQNADLNLENLQRSSRDYTKIWVSPYSDLHFGKSMIPPPSGATRARILEGLFCIYDSWLKKLKTLDQPFYLKIWLYEDRFLESQVVCAIDGMIDFYETTFPKPDGQKEINTSSYGALSKKMEEMNWEYRKDIDIYYDDTVGAPDEYPNLQEYYDHNRWFRNLLKKPHNTYPLEDPTEFRSEYYAFDRGTIWLGSTK